MVTADNDVRKKKATLKCKTEYRKLITKLNKVIDTLQIKQCANTWSQIDFNKVTSVSLSKQKKAFLNINKKGEIRYPDREDRVTCAEHFDAHVQKAVRGEVEMKGKRVGMADFTTQARQLNFNPNSLQVEKDLLNSQWRDNSSQNGALDNFIAVVDISGSMSGDPMDVAIALGIRIAEKSKLGKRVMTFTNEPKWINLEPYDDFVSQVKAIESSEAGYNTNFYKVLNLFLDAVVENEMEPEDVQDMVIVLLSDMQIDEAEHVSGSRVVTNGPQKRDTLYKNISKKYAEAGIRVKGKPYNPPHMLFWNLRNTNGFPCMSNEKNVSMMSGFSPALLNVFCEKGIEALQSCTPWSILEESLAVERYKIMGDYLEIHL
jgi:Mg-chelatase subunit ChlD